MKKSSFQTAVAEDFAAMFLVAKLQIIFKKICSKCVNKIDRYNKIIPIQK